MQQVVQELIVLVIVMAVGAVFGRRGLLDEKCTGYLNGVVMKIAFPALILASMDKDFTTELLRNSLGLVVISACCFGAVIVFLEIWRKLSKRPEKELGMLQFLVIFGNTAFMGYPVISAIYGDTGVFYASMFNLMHNFVCFSYGLMLLKRDRKTSAKQLFGNVGFIATVIGFLIFIIPGTLPYVIHRPLEWVGNLTIPICLLIVGAKLGRAKPRDLVRPASIWMTSLIRLVAFPAVLLAVLGALHLNEYWIAIPTIIFGTPVALTAAAFAAEYGNDEYTVGKAVALSNLLAVVTMPIVVSAVMMVLGK